MRSLIVGLVFLTACAMADPVAKKTESAAMTITGIVTSEGVECPAVRGDDKKLYTIVGKGREKLTPGVRVKITGTVAQMSTMAGEGQISPRAAEGPLLITNVMRERSGSG